MARSGSGSKGGRPRKYPEGTVIKQLHIDVPEQVYLAFTQAAQARGLRMVDWATSELLAAIGEPLPRAIQEVLPLPQS